MLFKSIFFLALAALVIARPNPSSLKTIASSSGVKSSIKSPSQKLAEKNNSPSVASIIEAPAINQGVSQTENLNINLPQGQDTDAALQYSQELVQPQATNVVPAVSKEVPAPLSSSQNEVVKPTIHSNVALPVENTVAAQEVPAVKESANVASSSEVFSSNVAHPAVENAPPSNTVAQSPLEKVVHNPVQPSSIVNQPNLDSKPALVNTPVHSEIALASAPPQPQASEIVNTPVHSGHIEEPSKVLHNLPSAPNVQSQELSKVNAPEYPANSHLTESSSSNSQPSLANEANPNNSPSVPTTNVQPQVAVAQSQDQFAPAEVVNNPTVPVSKIVENQPSAASVEQTVSKKNAEFPALVDQPSSSPVEAPKVVALVENKPASPVVETNPVAKPISN